MIFTIGRTSIEKLLGGPPTKVYSVLADPVKEILIKTDVVARTSRARKVTVRFTELGEELVVKSKVSNWKVKMPAGTETMERVSEEPEAKGMSVI